MPEAQDDVVKGLVAQWLRAVYADMTVVGYPDEERIAPEVVAYHSQQVVEKTLKALLVQRQVDFPRTHSIGALLALCADAGYLGVEALNEAGSLTRYAVATRYPGEDDPVSREEAREAAKLATRVFAWGIAQIEV